MVQLLYILQLLFLQWTPPAESFNFLPSSGVGETIKHGYYTLSYIEAHEQPQWVAYSLTKLQAETIACKRSDKFRTDPAVSTGSTTLADYKGSGYDRGHLCPAADMRFDCLAMSETFFLSNMSPQKHSFNAGIWKTLETHVRDLAISSNKIYVVTGPVLKSGLPSIGRNEVSVPVEYYKVVFDYEEPGIKMYAWLMSQTASGTDLSPYRVSVNEIEKLTSIDFFPALPDELENRLEKTK